MALRENEGAPERYRIQVEPGEEGQRLDRFLTDSLEGLSRERIKEVVLDGGVSIDGAVELRNSTSVHAGTWIDVVVTLRDRTRAGSEGGADYTLLYEDADILVVGKPAGMVVHPSERVRGGTISELLAIKYPGLPSPQGEDRPGIVNRLDAETSGVLVIARTEAAGEELKRQFTDREVHKVYTAIVYGELRFDADWIEEPIGRMRGSERVGVLSVANGGRKASTFYRTVERLGQATLIHCEPRTGRTHQIRVHMESIGHPVVGDKLYRGKRVLRLPGGRFNVDRHLLHAEQLTFTHPSTGERVTFSAPLPTDFDALLEVLRAKPEANEA